MPVRLLRPEANLRKKNIDRMYDKSFTDDMKAIDPLFGSDAVVYLSMDDKAKVSLGLAAAKLQAPILMHLDYKVRLNDHDFVVGGRHKLIPSVYSQCELLKENGKVSNLVKTSDWELFPRDILCSVNVSPIIVGLFFVQMI